MDDTDRVTVDGETYVLDDWPFEEGKRWSVRLIMSLAPVMGDSAGLSQSELFAKLLGGFGEATANEFIDTALKYTRIVGRDDRGAETIRPLVNEVRVTLRRKYYVAFALAAAHGRRQFGDFFGRLPELLTAAGIVSPGGTKS